MHRPTDTAPDAIVVGGGLGGLLTAALLGRRGLRVEVLEAAAPGGRAATTSRAGYDLNLGGHALYAGPAWRTLRDLGVPLPGRRPPASRVSLVRGDGAVGLADLLRPSPAALGDLAAFATFGAGLLRHDGRRATTTVDAWLRAAVPRPVPQAIARAYAHVATFSAADGVQSADVAAAQLLAAQRRVHYVDGGWHTIVDGLAGRVRAAGGAISPGTRVSAVLPRDGSGAEVVDAAGRVRRAPVVVLAAGGPATAARLLDGEAGAAAAAWAERATRVGVTAVDLCLDRPLASPLAFDLEHPVFLTEQSRAARIAPPGGAVVHALRYHGAGAARGGQDVGAHVAEVEAVLDRVDPAWREAVVDRRVLPDLTASHWLPTPATGGLAGRPAPAVPHAPGVFVVGDWVGPEGHLANAVAASARRVDAAVAGGAGHAPARRPAEEARMSA